MANPTVKSGIAQAANLKAALWVSPDVVGGAGAWEAVNSVRYAPWGTLNSVQLGSSAHYGLSSPGATNCGIDLGLAIDHTGTPFDFTTSAFTLVVCAERNATSGIWRMIENVQEYAPSNGWVFVVDSGYLQLQDTPLSYPSGVIVTNNETAVFAVVYNGTTCKLYKNGTEIASGAATGAVSYGSTGYGRRASLFNLSQARGLTAAAGKIFGALVYDVALSAAELQTFGTTNGAIIAGSFHDAAFTFGGTTHDATGALAATAATIAGTSARSAVHTSTGALAASAATIAGAAARSGAFVTHASTGALAADAAVVSGTAARSGASVTHTSTGALTASAAAIAGTASHAAAGQLVTDVLINNTGTVLASTAVYWSWLPIGRIGSLSAITPVDGTGTTSAGGTLTVSGLSAGAGILLVAKRNTGASDDYVYYQAGTVA